MAADNRIRVEERLFSLVLALLATERGLTKTEILSTVQGYSSRFASGGDNANLERQFERDKDEIRELGVPLETVDSPGEAGNNQHTRYRIPRGEYELPQDVSFTPEETLLLSLAAMVWQGGAISGESRRALLKLRSLAGTARLPSLGYLPRLRVREEAWEPLRLASERHQTVSFDYLKPGESAPTRRTVHPYALLQHAGRWLCYAADAGTGQHRTFLLSRIVSTVTPTGSGFEAPPSDIAEQGRAELHAHWSAQTAQLQVSPGSDAAVRLSHREGSVLDGERLTLHYTDLHILADELAGFGSEVIVLEPGELRTAVIDRLRTLLDAHGDGEHGRADG